MSHRASENGPARAPRRPRCGDDGARACAPTPPCRRSATSPPSAGQQGREARRRGERVRLRRRLGRTRGGGGGGERGDDVVASTFEDWTAGRRVRRRRRGGLSSPVPVSDARPSPCMRSRSTPHIPSLVRHRAFPSRRASDPCLFAPRRMDRARGAARTAGRDVAEARVTAGSACHDRVRRRRRQGHHRDHRGARNGVVDSAARLFVVDRVVITSDIVFGPASKKPPSRKETLSCRSRRVSTLRRLAPHAPRHAPCSRPCSPSSSGSPSEPASPPSPEARARCTSRALLSPAGAPARTRTRRTSTSTPARRPRSRAACFPPRATSPTSSASPSPATGTQCPRGAARAVRGVPAGRRRRRHLRHGGRRRDVRRRVSLHAGGLLPVGCVEGCIIGNGLFENIARFYGIARTLTPSSWRGKCFSEERVASNAAAGNVVRNRIKVNYGPFVNRLLGLEEPLALYEGKARHGDSWFNASEDALVVEYDVTEHEFSGFRDELREIHRALRRQDVRDAGRVALERSLRRARGRARVRRPLRALRRPERRSDVRRATERVRGERYASRGVL